ncbi:MAG: response regulator [Candidatus Omnitrophica bacterium]|nr:response regulator [Candidatus Omnitrophota bacterium]
MAPPPDAPRRNGGRPADGGPGPTGHAAGGGVARETILIVDDDPDIRDVVKLALTPAGYDLVEAADGEQALELIRSRAPNLVLIDYMMPKMDGAQVCRVLKEDVLLRHLPIIMLTARGELSDKIHGLDAGADDYIVKPFEPKELVARVKMVLRRTTQDLDANPLTRLPGNLSIQQELQARIDRDAPYAVCYIDIDKFKSLNDKYGFERGDEAIRQTARILLKALQERGERGDFLGHIGGDDFVIITTPLRADALCEQILREFDAMAPSLYNKEDRQAGFLVGKDRQGNIVHVPLLTISIGVVTNSDRRRAHVAEIAEVGAELKAYAKRVNKSLYVKERRQVT